MSSPAHKIRIGSLQATIWRNSGDKGSWYSVKLTRGYRAEDDSWRDSDSLGSDDLLPAAKLLDLAHTWVMHAQQADARARKEAAAAGA